MARPIKIIYDSINAVKNADPYFKEVLSDDVSTTSVWRKQTECYATEINLMEKYIDATKAEIDALFANRQWGSAEWYTDTVKEFQLDHLLNSTTRKYDIVDATKRIVTRAAFQEVEEGGKNTILLKVAKGNVEDLQRLSASELQQVRGYMNRKKLAGIPLEVRSLDADLLSIYGEIYYNAELFEGEIKALVQTALNQYMMQLPFNGEVVVNDLIDALQALKSKGLIDVKLSSVVLLVDNVDEVIIDRAYITKSGYLKENKTEDNKRFLNTLTFIPKNI